MSELDNMKGYVFDIQHYSIHDGPGIRTTVFLSGCPLRCLWCQNPESQKLKPQLFFLGEKCIGCGKCVDVCPLDCITLQDGKAKTNRNLCNACGNCVDVCPVEARSIMGQEMTAGEVFAKVKSDKIFYDESGGGVTLSGGEALMQPEFSAGLLKLCRESGIHTAIETCGFAKWEVVEEVLSNVDLVLYDFKHFTSSNHKRLTGVENTLILENAKRIYNELHIPIAARIPVIPGYNDSDENITAISRFIFTELDNNVKVHLLPFHRLGEGKISSLEQAPPEFSSYPPSDEKMLELQNIVKSFGLEAVIGG